MRTILTRKIPRFLALLLALCLLTSVIAACSVGEGSESTSGDSSDGTQAPPAESTTEEPPAEVEPPLPDWAVEHGEDYDPASHIADENYGNEVTILYWSDVEMPEFEMVHGTVLDRPFYDRSIGVVQKLGIDYPNWIGVPGNHGQKEEFTEHVRTSYIAGERKYDIIATYSRTAAHCMIEGLLADLNAIENSRIDLAKPWWHDSLTENLTVDGALYFVSGDLSTNAIHMAYAIFCNEDLRTELKLEDPAQLALDGKWTLGRFMEFCEGVYLDLNGNEVRDVDEDRFGFTTTQLHVDAFYHGSGLRLIETDSDAGLLISPDFDSARKGTLQALLEEFLFSENVARSGNNEGRFAEKRVLFAQNRLYYGYRKLRNVGFDYTVLPTPMYDETQDGYRTCIGNSLTLWGIMADVEPEMQEECTALIEYFAAYNYAYITPVLFEVNTQREIDSPDSEEEIRLFELIRGNLIFDYGRILPDIEMGDYMNEVFVWDIIGTDWGPEPKPESRLNMYRANLARIIEKIRDPDPPAPVTEPLT